MDPIKEKEYIRQILDGNTGLFALFLEEYSEQVYRVISRIIRSQEESEELTQDVFMKAFRSLGSFKGDCCFSTWLFRIAYNSAISATRKKKIEYPSINEKIFNQVADNELDNLFEQDGNESLLRRLEEAVQKLGPEEQYLLTLYYNNNRPVKEIEEIMGLSAANVKIKLHRIRKKLYLMINDKNYGKG